MNPDVFSSLENVFLIIISLATYKRYTFSKSHAHTHITNAFYFLTYLRRVLLCRVLQCVNPLSRIRNNEILCFNNTNGVCFGLAAQRH